MTAARYKIDADTSALSMKLNRAKGQMTQLGNTVGMMAPGFGAMATSAGAIAAAGATAVRAWREWFDRMDKANREVKTLADTTQSIAFGVGRTGEAEAMANEIRRVAGEGRGTREQIGAGLESFTLRATSATLAQRYLATQQAGRLFNVGAGAGDVGNIMQAVGVLVDAGVDQDRALNIAAQLVTTAGADAGRMIRQLPVLLQAGISPEQALQVILAGRQMAGTRGVSKAAMGVEQFINAGGRGGFAGLQSFLNKQLAGLGGAAPGVAVADDFMAQQEAAARRDQELQLQNRLGAQRSRARNIEEAGRGSVEERLIAAQVEEEMAAGGLDPLGAERVLRQASARGYTSSYMRYLAAIGTMGASEAVRAAMPPNVEPMIVNNPNNE